MLSTLLSAIAGAGEMAGLPAGETMTMNSQGTTATQTAVNTNNKGQLNTANTGAQLCMTDSCLKVLF